jgi:YD repeat-containing protein
MKGYKASYNGRCNNFLYEVGKIYEMEEEPVLCKRGFHFCKKADDTLRYYTYLMGFVLFEVEAIGDIRRLDDKSCTNKIKIKRIVPKEEYNVVFEDTKFTFDENGNCILIVGKGFCNTYTYNGNTCTQKQINGDEYIHEFDEKKNYIKTTFPDGKTYEFKYDDNRNRIWMKLCDYKYEFKNGKWEEVL